MELAPKVVSDLDKDIESFVTPLQETNKRGLSDAEYIGNAEDAKFLDTLDFDSSDATFFMDCLGTWDWLTEEVDLPASLDLS